jgi:hypothetical protein
MLVDDPLIMSTGKNKILPSVESQVKGGNTLDSPLIQKN